MIECARATSSDFLCLTWPPSTGRPGIHFFANETRHAVSADLELLRRVGLGDHAAFAAVYDRHARLVFGVCRRILGDTTQAEDVTQTIFTQLWAKPEAFSGGNLTAWLARVARNASLDVMRSAAVRKREPEMPADLPARDDLAEEVFTRVRSDAIVQALAQLPGDQREAIERAYFAGLSYREVAEELGAPLGTIKSRIRAGLRSLWQTLNRTVAT
ncbi:MAG: sigma-70 family RNA polymerase sigma factor [Candidatus Eremiobacteraeota bacterium]|nr:sigma-70 family RNA polymerase sigma factor [Candidatus Eremiobacteraeota bacterium]